MSEWRPATDKDGKQEWSPPKPGPYPNVMEITRDAEWCKECNRQHIDRISRRREGDTFIYWRTIGPHWIGHFGSANEAKAAK